MNTELAVVKAQAIVNLVLDGLSSDNSKRAYGKALTDFLDWYNEQGKPGLTKMTVQRYRAVLQDSGLSPSTINLRISAIRKLALEAADNGLIDPVLANGIKAVKGVKSAGVRVGNWLDKEDAQKLLDSPDTTMTKGLRDKALLAIMLGCGLRRVEVSNLTFHHIQQREGRWVIVDLVGKRNRIRTVPMPGWAKAAIDVWTEAADINEGYVFRSMRKGGRVVGDSMTPQAVYNVVKEYAGDVIAAHDMRRTFAKLAHKGGSGLDQIQLSLGHASIKTTERYLGVEQDLTNAPCDHLGLT